MFRFPARSFIALPRKFKYLLAFYNENLNPFSALNLLYRAGYKAVIKHEELSDEEVASRNVEKAGALSTDVRGKTERQGSQPYRLFTL
jgi:hypothetical protein